MIRVDLAKDVLQLHGASMTGEGLFCKKLSAGSFLRFIQSQPTAVVVIEVCASVHSRARRLMRRGEL